MMQIEANVRMDIFMMLHLIVGQFIGPIPGA